MIGIVDYGAGNLRSVQKALAKDAEDIIRLAEAEGLSAHANAVRIRTKQ